jgi:hypothetical protein
MGQEQQCCYPIWNSCRSSFSLVLCLHTPYICWGLLWI